MSQPSGSDGNYAPTRLQPGGAGGQHPPAPASGDTWAPTTLTGGSGGGGRGGSHAPGVASADDDAAWSRIDLPPGLRDRYRIVKELAALGAEADVLLVEEIASTQNRFILKLGRSADVHGWAALEAIRRLGLPNVVQIMELDHTDGVWYEVQEWCRFGSLRQCIDEGARIDPVDVVRQLAAAVGAIHRAGYGHFDIKPDNVFVRSVEPLVLALGDFGMAARLQNGGGYLQRGGNVAYAPPEASSGLASAAWDWWSMGIVMVELATHTHPFARDDEFLPDERIRYLLSQSTIDVSNVADPRVRRLCAGLLIRSAADRWGANQVASWLAGDDPAVETQISASPGAWFDGVEHTSADSLIAAFTKSWGLAAEQLFESRNPTLREETSAVLRAAQLDHALAYLESDEGGAALRLGRVVGAAHPAFSNETRQRTWTQYCEALQQRYARLPPVVRTAVRPGDVFQAMFADVVAGRSAKRVLGGIKGRNQRVAKNIGWWDELSRESEASVAIAELAVATTAVAVESANRVHRVKTPDVARPRQRRRGATVLKAFAVLVLVAGAGTAGVFGVDRWRDRNQEKSASTTVPTVPTSPASSIAVASEPPVPIAPGFAPETGQFGTFPDVPKEDLAEGSQGDAVRYLQGVLVAKTGATIAVDGVFGPDTTQAVANLQSFVGAAVTGAVDQATWAVVDGLAHR